MNIIKNYKEMSVTEAVFQLWVTLIFCLLVVTGKLLFELLTGTYTDPSNPLILGLEILILIFITVYLLFATLNVLKKKQIIIWKQIILNLLILWMITIPLAILLAYLLFW